MLLAAQGRAQYRDRPSMARSRPALPESRTEDAALAGYRADADSPPVRLDDLLDRRKAQADARLLRARQPAERLEHERLGPPRQPRPVVVHLDSREVTVGLLAPDLDSWRNAVTLAAVLRRVANQVGEDAGESAGRAGKLPRRIRLDLKQGVD